MNTEKKFENHILEQSNGTAILTFNHDLTIKDIDSLRYILMRLLENSERIVVNFERAINVDSICLQILCMARRISRRLKKPMILTGKFTEIVRQRLESSSCNCLDCTFLNNKICILSEASKEYSSQTVPKI